MIKQNNITLVSVTGEKDTTILSSKVLGEISIESFDLSKNKNKILLFTNAKKVWRYKTRGDYFVFDLKQQKLTKIGKDFPPSSLMFAKFSRDEKNIAYVVKDNLKNKIRNSSTSSNIFIEDLEKGTTRKLTTSEGKEKLINGTFDWVYEEEFNCRDGFIFNEDGTGEISSNGRTIDTGTWSIKDGKIHTVNSGEFGPRGRVVIYSLSAEGHLQPPSGGSVFKKIK